MRCALAAVVALTLPATAAAQPDYPSKKITMIVGSAPGGGDTLARVVALATASRS